MLKKNIATVLFCLITAISFAQTQTVISGTLINFGDKVYLKDISEYGSLLLTSKNIAIIPDSAGKFKLSIKLNKPGYFLLNRNHLYLSPGDHLSIFIDAKKAATTTFSGRGAAANNYLKKNYAANMGAYIYGGANIKETPQATSQYILEQQDIRRKELDELKEVSKDFKRLEFARIKADVILSIQAAPIYIKYSKKIVNTDSFTRVFKSMTDQLKNKYLTELTDASLLSVATFRDILSTIIKHDTTGAGDLKKLEDYQKAISLSVEMVAEHDKSKLTNFQARIDSLQNMQYRAALKSNLRELMQFGVGDEAANFKGIDLHDKNVNLSDLKGKVIYVDLWATWCAPCIREMPALEALKEKYRNDERIVFLSVSVDEVAAITKWKNNVAGRNAKGYQWRVDNSELTPYNVVGIPRVLLINKEFKIASMEAPLPSDPSVSETLNALLK